MLEPVCQALSDIVDKVYSTPGSLQQLMPFLPPVVSSLIASFEAALSPAAGGAEAAAPAEAGQKALAELILKLTSQACAVRLSMANVLTGAACCYCILGSYSCKPNAIGSVSRASLPP